MLVATVINDTFINQLVTVRLVSIVRHNPRIEKTIYNEQKDISPGTWEHYNTDVIVTGFGAKAYIRFAYQYTTRIQTIGGTIHLGYLFSLL